MNRKFGFLAAGMVLCGLIGTGCQAKNASSVPASAEPAVEGTSARTNAADLIKDIPTVQAFTGEAVDEADVQSIVAAGINAPSAMNSQPWHFTVITDKAALEDIAGNMHFGKPGEGMPMPKGETPPAGLNLPEGAAPPEGGKPSSGEKPAPPTSGSGAKAGISDAPLVIIVSCKDGSELDVGLATENMSAEAQLLGYGTKIISSPTIALNGNKKEEYKTRFGIPEDMQAVCVLLVGKTDGTQYDAVSGATARKNVEDLVTYVK